MMSSNFLQRCVLNYMYPFTKISYILNSPHPFSFQNSFSELFGRLAIGLQSSVRHWINSIHSSYVVHYFKLTVISTINLQLLVMTNIICMSLKTNLNTQYILKKFMAKLCKYDLCFQNHLVLSYANLSEGWETALEMLP